MVEEMDYERYKTWLLEEASWERFWGEVAINYSWLEQLEQLGIIIEINKETGERNE